MAFLKINHQFRPTSSLYHRSHSVCCKPEFQSTNKSTALREEFIRLRQEDERDQLDLPFAAYLWILSGTSPWKTFEEYFNDPDAYDILEETGHSFLSLSPSNPVEEDIGKDQWENVESEYESSSQFLDEFSEDESDMSSYED